MGFRFLFIFYIRCVIMSLKYEVKRGKNLRYYRHDEYHRKHFPAVICNTTSLFWYEYGVSHRLDGHANIFCNGEAYYYIRGTYCTKEEYDSKIRNIKSKRFGRTLPLWGKTSF